MQVYYRLGKMSILQVGHICTLQVRQTNVSDECITGWGKAYVTGRADKCYEYNAGCADECVTGWADECITGWAEECVTVWEDK